MTIQAEEDHTVKKSGGSRTIKHAIAGGLSGSITRCVCQPLDVLKVRFQLQVEPIAKGVLDSKYNSIWHALCIITREEGAMALWKGHNASQLMSILHGAAQFWTYEYLMILSKEVKALDRHSSARSFICGAMAGGPAAMLSNPFDVIRTRLIAQDHRKGYRNATHAFTKILRKEGVLGLYRGLKPSLFQIVPFMGINFMVYTTLAELVLTFYTFEERGQLPTSNLLALGATSGTVSKMIVYPFDLVKRRLQVQGFEKNRQAYGKNFDACTDKVLACIRIIAKTEGFLALYKGMIPTLIKAAALSAVQFGAYDKILRFLF